VFPGSINRSAMYYHRIFFKTICVDLIRDIVGLFLWFGFFQCFQVGQNIARMLKRFVAGASY
jgi:hypothetical protein